jgi:uracil-DNA glycosylase
MYGARLAHPTDLEGWRAQARTLLAGKVPPEAVAWQLDGEAKDLFGGLPVPHTAAAAVPVPRAFLDLAESIIRHRNPERFTLLYRLLWRQTHGERDLLAVRVDADVARAAALAQQVHRAAYHMKAYLRFHEVLGEGGPVYAAWFEPEHHVVERVAPHFVTRMGALRWSILTPLRSAHWDGAELCYAAGRPGCEVAGEDAVVECWKTYYASIFNPARLKVDAMLAQMPKKYWRNMEETMQVPAMVRGAAGRAEAMVAAPFAPPAAKGRVHVERRVPMAGDVPASLDEFRALLPGCRRCPLWEHATQAVAGEGPAGALVMLVGEQPGDQEDLAGRPFVGPAGQLLDRALGEAGLGRERVYVTNAVKHFKYEPRGKRRIHQKPGAGEVTACRFWLDRELALVQPRLVVALGATAARAVLGREVAVTRLRGQLLAGVGSSRVLVTFHPSAILRQPDASGKERQFSALVEDLALAALLVAG